MINGTARWHFREIEPQEWTGRDAEGALLALHAGEMLFLGESLLQVAAPVTEDI